MKVNVNKINKFVELERKRLFLVKNKNLGKFRQTYTKTSDFIDNANSGAMWDEINSREINFKSNPMAWDRTFKFSKLIKNGDTHVLNVGFGPALLETMLKSDGLHNSIKVVGIDISKRSVIGANHKFPNWKFMVGSIQSTKLQKGSFDYVIASEVLEHINSSEVLNVLNKMKSLLKNNGKLIISVPLNEGLETLLKNGVNPNAHVRIYSEETITSEIEITGFRVIQKTKLFAFHNFYHLKSAIASIFKSYFKPNNMIVVATKK